MDPRLYEALLQCRPQIMTQTASSDHFQCPLPSNLQFSPVLKVTWSGLQEYFSDWFHSLPSPTLQSILHTAAGVIGLKSNLIVTFLLQIFWWFCTTFRMKIQAFQCGSYQLDVPVLPTSTTTWITILSHHFCPNFPHLLEILHTGRRKYCYVLTKSHFTFLRGTWQKWQIWRLYRMAVINGRCLGPWVTAEKTTI